MPTKLQCNWMHYHINYFPLRPTILKKQQQKTPNNHKEKKAPQKPSKPPKQSNQPTSFRKKLLLNGSPGGKPTFDTINILRFC